MAKKPRRHHVDRYGGPASEPHKHRGHFRSDGIAKRSYLEWRARSMAERRSTEAVPLNAYPCPEDWCDAWHIGRAPRS